MTDDSRGAQRGGVPVPEDAGATASAAPHDGVAGRPEPSVPHQAQDPDATIQYTTAPGPAAGSPPQAAGSPPQAAGAPAQAEGVPVQAAGVPAQAAGAQTPVYGPFHTSPHATWGGTPWTAAPTSDAGPTSPPPGWSATNPASAPAAPTSGAGTPVSGAPGSPVSGAPGIPVSGAPGIPANEYGLEPPATDQYGLPTTPGNRFGGSTGSPAAPYTPTTSDADRFGFDVAPSYSGPRIEPTPKQPKSRLILPALAGLLAGLLIFGTAGWFAGRATAPDPSPTGTTVAGPTPSPSPTEGVYEQNQIAINQPKFAGSLGTVAQGWLPHLSGCKRNGDKGGPTLTKGEKARVRCEMDAMSVIFVEYATTADRDKARVTTLGQNVDARTLTPGVGVAAERATPSGRTNGNYVEYAYKVSGRTVAGIWWDDTDTPVAAYLLAYWKEGVGEKWEPMRDIWARYA